MVIDDYVFGKVNEFKYLVSTILTTMTGVSKSWVRIHKAKRAYFVLNKYFK